MGSEMCIRDRPIEIYVNIAQPSLFLGKVTPTIANHQSFDPPAVPLRIAQQQFVFSIDHCSREAVRVGECCGGERQLDRSVEDAVGIGIEENKNAELGS